MSFSRDLRHVSTGDPGGEDESLTAEQVAALHAIPAIGSDPEQLIEAHAAIAREYLTRARRLTALLGEAWPAELERASVELWRDQLGVRLDQPTIT